jgi:hypothetical protein
MKAGKTPLAVLGLLNSVYDLQIHAFWAVVLLPHLEPNAGDLEGDEKTPPALWANRRRALLGQVNSVSINAVLQISWQRRLASSSRDA